MPPIPEKTPSSVRNATIKCVLTYRQHLFVCPNSISTKTYVLCTAYEQSCPIFFFDSL